MFLTRKHLSRRTVLKGAGATIALPLLDAMIPAGTAFAQTAAAPATRLGFIYFPHGALQDEWQPKTIGPQPRAAVHLGAAEPAARVRHRGQRPAQQVRRRRRAARHRARDVAQLRALRVSAMTATGKGVSADQIAAQYLAEGRDAAVDGDLRRAGRHDLVPHADQPLPMEGNPRKVFISMFGQGQTKAERQAILGTTASLLDYVTDSTASLNGKLDAADRAKVERLLGLGSRDRAARAEARGEQRNARPVCPMRRSARRTTSASCSPCSSRCSRSHGRRTARTWSR